VDRLTETQVVDLVRGRLSSTEHRTPLAVGSVNLDHLHHFRSPCAEEHEMDWLMLADGLPVARRGAKLTGEPWPRLTGADLLPSLLVACEQDSRRVGFLGGLPHVHRKLADVLAQRFSSLDVAGYWSPDRSELADSDRSDQLAREIDGAKVDMLVVGLGKPRQEDWIDRHGLRTGATVLLAFGASADFLAGAVSRAPQLIQRHSLEWLYRLLHEPRRLSRRYLLEGPPSLLRLRTAVLARPAAALERAPERTRPT